jgi:DNA repair photolyase
VAEAGWTELDRRERGTHFISLESKSALNSPTGTGMAFWSINPYVGCEFGCAYCYARNTHRWTIERAASRPDAPPQVREAAALPSAVAFERRILVKTGVAEVLARTIRPARIGKVAIVIGSATDPYQPAERRFHLTRDLLQALRRHPGLHIGIITKSPLIVRDAELLAELSAQSQLSVHFSLASLDAPLLRLLEPRTPAPHARLRAIHRLASAGVAVGMLIAPILPGLTDGTGQLRALISAARLAGAQWAAGSPLRMNPATRNTLFPWLERERPELARRYRLHYGARHHVTTAYADALRRRINALQREFGFSPKEGFRRESELVEPRHPMEPQTELWE